VPSHQRASIYGRSDGVYVASDDRTIDGFYVIGAAQRLAADADDDALGLAILSALDRSRDGVPTPGPGVAVADSLVSLSSSRTWHSFAKAAVLVGVVRDGATVAFEPWRRTPGRQDAFEPSPERHAERIGGSDPTANGAVARRLLVLAQRP
jgi:hypothetical protein